MLRYNHQRAAKDKVVAIQLTKKNDKEDKKNFNIMMKTRKMNAAVNAVNNDTEEGDATPSNDANEEGEHTLTVVASLPDTSPPPRTDSPSSTTEQFESNNNECGNTSPDENIKYTFAPRDSLQIFNRLKDDTATTDTSDIPKLIITSKDSVGSNSDNSLSTIKEVLGKSNKTKRMSSLEYSAIGTNSNRSSLAVLSSMAGRTESSDVPKITSNGKLIHTMDTVVNSYIMDEKVVKLPPKSAIEIYAIEPLDDHDANCSNANHTVVDGACTRDDHEGNCSSPSLSTTASSSSSDDEDMMEVEEDETIVESSVMSGSGNLTVRKRSMALDSSKIPLLATTTDTTTNDDSSKKKQKTSEPAEAKIAKSKIAANEASRVNNAASSLTYTHSGVAASHPRGGSSQTNMNAGNAHVVTTFTTNTTATPHNADPSGTDTPSESNDNESVTLLTETSGMIGDETNKEENILFGDDTQAGGIVSLTKQQYSTLFLKNYVEDVMPGVKRQTTLSIVAAPILECGNAVPIIEVKVNDVLFIGLHADRSISRHFGNRRLYELVKDVLISNPTNDANKDRRDDITTIINTLVANGGRWLFCDNEQECFVPMDIVKVRTKVSIMFTWGLTTIMKHIESCENYHTLIAITDVKGAFRVSIILIYSFFYSYLSNLTQVLSKQFNFVGKGKKIQIATKSMSKISRPQAHDLIKKVYNFLHPSFNAAVFASHQTRVEHVNGLKTAMKRVLAESKETWASILEGGVKGALMLASVLEGGVERATTMPTKDVLNESFATKRAAPMSKKVPPTTKEPAKKKEPMAMEAVVENEAVNTSKPAAAAIAEAHDYRSKGGFEVSIRNANKLNKPYLLLESVSRCDAAKKARPKFVPMCTRIQNDLMYELETEGSLKITNLAGPQAKMKRWIKSANDNERDKSHTFSVRGFSKNRALYPDDEWKITVHPTKATIRGNVRFVEGDRETAKLTKPE
jgi:hypothetical protein